MVDILNDTGDEQGSKPGQDSVINYDSTFDHIREGQVVKGRVIRVSPKGVLVDIGYKSEGFIHLEEFDEPGGVKVGDEIDVYLETRETEEGHCVLSRRKAERSQSWDLAVRNFKEGDVVQGKVARKVKGGLMMDMGIEAFLPASLAFVKGYGNLNALVGQTFEVKIIKINHQRRNIIVSRKDLIEKEKQQTKEKVFSELEVGQIRTGTVKNITDFGAFINLGGLDGLLHVTDMSWGRVGHPTEILKVGDKVSVKVLNFDRSAMKVSLGLKQNTPNPWDDVDQRYPVGSRVQGTVVNVVPYGIFVEIEKGIEGLVHVSEMSWSKRATNPGELFKSGDRVDMMVLAVDKASQKLSLGIRQTEKNPWIGIEERYPAGTKIKGTVWHLTDFGAFVQVQEGVDGLIHISDLSWTRKINHPREILKKGQEVEVIVLNVDQINRKLALGLKQLEEDPWVKIAARYPVDTVIEGEVTKVATFGVFVEIENDVEGLLHISEMSPELAVHLKENFPPGKKIQTRIIKIDPTGHKIALSLRGL